MFPPAGFQLLWSVPAPWLTVSFPYNTSDRGERIWLKCSPPDGWRAEKFHFYKRNSNGGIYWSKEQKENTLEVSPKHQPSRYQDRRTSREVFACRYQGAKGKGIGSLSLWSNEVVLSLTGTAEPPLPGTLSLHPQHSVYLRGEQVTLTCSAPGGLQAPAYAFYKRQPGQSQEQPLPERKGSATLQVGPDTAGNYSCAYWILRGGRPAQSLPSNIVRITVRDPPPPPALTVDPPSGALREGGRLLLSCSADGGPAERRFRFFKDGAELASSSEDSLGSSRELGNASTALRIPRAELRHSGEFGCRYEENMSGRWILSPWSPKVDVTVSPKPSLMHACWSIPLLLVMVPLTLCCWRRRKRGRKRRMAATRGQQEAGPGEEKADTQGPQAAALQEQGSEVTYAPITFASPFGGAMENRLQVVEMERVVYGEVLLRSTSSRRP